MHELPQQISARPRIIMQASLTPHPSPHSSPLSPPPGVLLKYSRTQQRNLPHRELECTFPVELWVVGGRQGRGSSSLSGRDLMRAKVWAYSLRFQDSHCRVTNAPIYLSIYLSGYIFAHMALTSPFIQLSICLPLKLSPQKVLHLLDQLHRLCPPGKPL